MDRETKIQWLAGVIASVALLTFAPPSRGDDEATLRATELNHLASGVGSAASVHVQTTVIPQGHPGLGGNASGPGVLSSQPELNTSATATVFAGVRPWSGTELYLNPEAGAGTGISGTQGIAAYPNGEIYRVGDPAPRVYVARAFVRQTVGLGGPQESVENDLNQIAGHRDISRLTFTAGKFALPDLFDDNLYSHDARTQFMNWGLMQNGTWDVASDTRGYTWAVAVELNEPTWAVRFASGMMPTTANGAVFDDNIGQARGDNLELEYRYSLAEHPGRARLLAYANHADMGSYSETLANPAYGMDITKTRAYRTRYGIGLNIEQELTPNVGVFARLGWNDGQEETWAYTEMDQTVSGGMSVRGSLWSRPSDTVGVAGVLGGISAEHRAYLAAGGSGFMLGGGLPGYALEKAIEIYYAWGFWRACSATVDYQEVFNPGYNLDRGPAAIFAGRLHLEI